MSTAIAVDKPDSTIDELATVVRTEIQQTHVAWSNGVRHAMNAGDALIALQPKVAARGILWKKWLKENCFVAVSTAELYAQLARNRDRIEAEIQRGIELSLRGARRLIAKPKEPEGNVEAADQANDSSNDSAPSSKPKPSLLETWKGATAAEHQQLLDHLKVSGVLEAASAKFKSDLQQRAKQPTNPNAWLVESDAAAIARKIIDAAGRTKADAVRNALMNLAVPQPRTNNSNFAQRMRGSHSRH
jgi:hypothetical protein